MDFWRHWKKYPSYIYCTC